MNHVQNTTTKQFKKIQIYYNTIYFKLQLWNNKIFSILYMFMWMDANVVLYYNKARKLIIISYTFTYFLCKVPYQTKLLIFAIIIEIQEITRL